MKQPAVSAGLSVKIISLSKTVVKVINLIIHAKFMAQKGWVGELFQSDFGCIAKFLARSYNKREQLQALKENRQVLLHPRDTLFALAAITRDKRYLVQRILSNWHLDLPDCLFAALSSIAVATATTLSSALHLKQSFCVNVPET